MGRSAFGPGIKAGGPNYVAQLMRFQDRGDGDGSTAKSVDVPELAQLRRELRERIDANDGGEPPNDQLERVLCAMTSYQRRYGEEFSGAHDDVRLVGQDNLRRYLPVEALRIRVHPDDCAFDIFARVCAAKTVGSHITVSSPPNLRSAAVELLDELTDPWGASIEFVQESDDDLIRSIAQRQTDRLRYAHPRRVPVGVRKAIGDSGIYIADSPVLVEGRIELLWYVREQSISHDYHRYGNLGVRQSEVDEGLRRLPSG
jgi:RHH-type proline utilization regulon transcriptional repressor/proline dehydrogenase/delta 1-pyrroline-5-carboxylate dehydrogenase